MVNQDSQATDGHEGGYDSTPAVEVMDLDGQISNELVKHNVTDAIIAQLKERYGSLRLRDIDDHETFLEISTAKREVRKWGILAEKITKKGREEAVAIQKKWLQKEKEILGKIAEVQDPLDAEIKKFEDEKERKERELAQKQEAQFQNRQQSIVRLGATWVDGSFVLGEISYEVAIIKESDDEMWNEVIFPKYKRVYDRVEAERAAEEEKRRLEAEKLAAEQEAFRKKQEEFAAQQRAFAEQQAELQKMKEEQERIKREAEEQKLAEQRKAQNELQSKRLTELLPYNKYGDTVDMATLWAIDEPSFNILLTNKKAIFGKAESERLENERIQREAEIEKAKQEAAQRELERIAAEQKQKELEAQQEQLRRQEEAAKASDSEKWDVVLKSLAAIQLPEMKSTIYKKKVAILKEKLEEVNSL